MRTPTCDIDFDELIPDEAAAVALLVQSRWPDGVCCPHCGCREMTRLTTRPCWQCRACRVQTSIRAGTALHRSRKPLRDWCYAAWKCSVPSGASTRSLAIDLGYRYETMWVMVHKIRAALAERGVWQLEGRSLLGTASLPVTKRAKGDPERRPPVVVALVVEEEPSPPDAEPIRLELAATPTQKDEDLLATARERHVDARAEVRIEPMRLVAPSLRRPPLLLAQPYRCIRTWLALRFGGVSRRYMANYLAQFAYVQNRWVRRHELFGWVLRRVVREPWRRRSDVALSAP